VVAFSLAVAGQTAKEKAVEPESIGVFFYLDPASQELKRLPTEDFKRHTSTHFASSTQSVQVSGEASSFRIASGDNAVFLFKVSEAQLEHVRLFEFEVKKSEREYELGKRKGRDVVNNTGLTVNIAKYGDSSYKLTPESPLKPGEYALTFGPTVFTFGVGGSGK
jgi:hypothetical protein